MIAPTNQTGTEEEQEMLDNWDMIKRTEERLMQQLSDIRKSNPTQPAAVKEGKNFSATLWKQTRESK
jgi:outer membrane lipopolysaccharide assembly protein LptE/RlpB